MLERRVNFDEARALASEGGAPGLVVGAVDVLNGAFADFRGDAIRVESILASAALPNLFPAVALGGRYFWDGLFSQNPPVRELTDYEPDEIWVVQVNRPGCEALPKTVDDIADRRNELSGNLSLEQELRYIAKVNELLRTGVLVNSHYRPITVRRIVLQRGLDYASKFDRSESLIRSLIAYGRERARSFLAERAGDLAAGRPAAADGRRSQ